MASSYYRREIIDIVSDHNSSDNAHSFSSTGTSSSNYHYTYFTALTSGTYRVYYKNDSTNSNYTIYAYIYNMTKGSVVKSNAGVTSTSYNYYSVTANAGDVIYIRTYRTNTNYSSTFSLYVTGGELPEAGGTVSNYISVSAEDSFGISLPVTIELKSGALTSGTYVVYTLTATDKLGNVSVVDTIPIGVYDVNDISFTYMNMASDIIKLTSKGEEFFAEATDSFGNACDITIEVAEGYVLSGGKIVSLYIVATDKAGNRVESDLISNIKVYDIPTVKLTDESKGYTIAEDGDLSFLFVASDSFGEELYVDITTQDTVTAGNIITVQVVAEDIAGNVLTTYFDIAVYAAQKPYVELIIEDVLWKGFYADGLQQIEVPTDWRLPFIGWSDADGNIYADENGNLLQTLSPYIRLYATSDFAPIDTVQQLKDIKIDGQYILFNDLSLSGVSWTSIGTESSPFIGVFDGNGHRITSLEFTNGSGRGLFAYSSGTIKNLTLSVYFSYVSGSGGLVVNNSGLIENCKVMGTITAGSNSTEGGIVCTNYATGIIRNSSSSVKVTAYGYVGGVAAINNGTITHCSASGTIQGGYFNSSSSSAEGGLVGSNTGSIECSYATGEISGGMYSGGLVGSSSKGSIINCYATGSVKGDTAGGLIGSNGGSVTNCYASGKVTASIGRSGGTNNYVYAYGGGLIGRNSGTVTRCFATGDVTVSASATGAKNCGATAYAGGLIGSESGTSTSCYRASTQTVTATKTIPSGTSDGTITETGTSYTISSIISSIRSSWGSTYWNFSSTSNPPTLK